MARSDNTFFRILDIFSHFLLLNAMWILACVPIITIFPATAALFGVGRKWVGEGIDAGLFSLFIKELKLNFKKSFLLGIIWSVGGLIIYYDFSILSQIEFTGEVIIYSLLIFMTILYVFTTIYLFYVLVNYELSLLHTIKNALLISISYIFHTLLCIGIIGFVVAITLIAPIFLLIFGSIIAFILCHVFQKLSVKIERRKLALN